MNLIIVLIIFIIIVLFFISAISTRESYIDPIYLFPQKIEEDWYPRTNGSIYGIQSNLYSGYSYYPKAY